MVFDDRNRFCGRHPGPVYEPDRGHGSASIGTLFAFSSSVPACCSRIRSSKKAERGSCLILIHNLFFPFFSVVGFLLAYFSGISSLNASNDPNKDVVRISSEKLEIVEPENPSAIRAIDTREYSKAQVLGTGLSSLVEFFSVSTTKRELEIDISGPTTKKVIKRRRNRK